MSILKDGWLLPARVGDEPYVQHLPVLTDFPTGARHVAYCDDQIFGDVSEIGAFPDVPQCRRCAYFRALEFHAEGGHWALGDSANDNEFSWSDCDSCGSHLGGSRHEATLFVPKYDSRKRRRKDTAIKCMICCDCLCFHANGDEPEDWFRSARMRLLFDVAYQESVRKGAVT